MGNNFPSTLHNPDKPLKNVTPLTVETANPPGWWQAAADFNFNSS